MLNINHLNPSKSKVPFPILKNSYMNESVGRKQSCPQIARIRNSRSAANILKEDHHRLLLSTNHNNEAQNENHNSNICAVAGKNQIIHKRSVQTILGQEKLRNLEHAHHTQSRQCLCKDPGFDGIDKVLKENVELMAELGKKQQQLKSIQQSFNKLEQKYIRLLEITNERSQSHVKILLQEGQSRLNKSKLKNSAVSEQAQRLKAKLEGLDISSIKPSKQKDSSFKLSQMMN